MAARLPYHGLKASKDELRLLRKVGRHLSFKASDGIPVGMRSDGQSNLCYPDLVFRKYAIAVFWDGCYWHECPDHHPNSHRGKVRAKDARQVELLKESGWLVLRFWEHQGVDASAEQIVSFVRANFDHRPMHKRSLTPEQIAERNAKWQERWQLSERLRAEASARRRAARPRSY